MGKLTASTSFGLGSSKTTERVFSNNHFSEAKLSPEVKAKIASMGLTRVAGNAFICSADQEFWTVRGNKVIKLTLDEVDTGQSLAAAPTDNPASFLSELLGDLTF